MVPGTFDWSKTILLALTVSSAYCTAPSELYRGPMLTAALFGVDQHSGAMPESPSAKMPTLLPVVPRSIVHSMIELLPMTPTTWSVVTSCLASEAIWDGLVCSVSGKNLIGWPLIPPLAFTQAKYAPSMFSMSLKLVPGWSVLIAPMLIGVPVAATPGLLPQAEVDVVLAEELDAEEAAALVAAGALEVAAGALVELVELELQAARTPSDSTAAAAAAVRVRQ